MSEQVAGEVKETLVDELRSWGEDGYKVCGVAADRIEELERERDKAREECGHEKHMRQFVSDERDRWIKKHSEFERSHGSAPAVDPLLDVCVHGIQVLNRCELCEENDLAKRVLSGGVSREEQAYQAGWNEATAPDAQDEALEEETPEPFRCEGVHDHPGHEWVYRDGLTYWCRGQDSTDVPPAEDQGTTAHLNDGDVIKAKEPLTLKPADGPSADGPTLRVLGSTYELGDALYDAADAYQKAANEAMLVEEGGSVGGVSAYQAKLLNHGTALLRLGFAMKGWLATKAARSVDYLGLSKAADTETTGRILPDTGPKSDCPHRWMPYTFGYLCSLCGMADARPAPHTPVVDSTTEPEPDEWRERPIEEDFYLDPNGKWVYRWNEQRWVLEAVDDVSHADAREWVSSGEIQAQRDAGWPDFHPEDFCHKCGNRNISWWVDSDRFNAAMKALGGEPRSEIVCPVCFVLAHEQAVDMHGTWRLVPEVLVRGQRERAADGAGADE